MSDMMRLFSEAFCLPITTFATGVESVARKLQCDGGWNDRCWNDDDSWRHEGRHDRWDGSDDGGAGWGWSWGEWSCGCGCGCERCRQGECCGRHHGSRTVKLVEWSLLRVARGRTAPCGPKGEEGEHHHHHRGSEVLDSGECMVSGDTSLEEFRNEILVHYARAHRDVEGRNLRVYVRVLARYEKPHFDFEEEQIDALHEIRNAIGQKGGKAA